MSDADIKVIDTEIDLIYSSDDGGWYFQHFPSYKTSQLFAGEELAMKAYRNKTLEWED